MERLKSSTRAKRRDLLLLLLLLRSRTASTSRALSAHSSTHHELLAALSILRYVSTRAWFAARRVRFVGEPAGGDGKLHGCSWETRLTLKCAGCSPQALCVLQHLPVLAIASANLHSPFPSPFVHAAPKFMADLSREIHPPEPSPSPSWLLPLSRSIRRR